jgi:hypothetical protein
MIKGEAFGALFVVRLIGCFCRISSIYEQIGRITLPLKHSYSKWDSLIINQPMLVDEWIIAPTINNQQSKDIYCFFSLQLFSS